MTFETVDPSIANRLKSASYALGVVEKLRDIADDVASWDACGLGRKEIDARIARWMADQGHGFDTWLDDPEIAALSERFPQSDMRRLWEAYGFERWVKECVWSIALTEEPIPFYPLTMGFMYDDKSDPDFPVVIAVMTPLTDVELAVSQIRNKLHKEFGKRAVGRDKKDELEAARMLAMKREGMSYREIAIQMLRDRFPEIVRNPRKYRTQIETERSRVAKRIKAAEQVWKERHAEPSTAE